MWPSVVKLHRAGVRTRGDVLFIGFGGRGVRRVRGQGKRTQAPSSLVEWQDCTFYSSLHYLLTPWCRVLPEQLTGLQLVKKFPAFHGTRKFISALTSVRHLSLSWASPLQSIYPHPTSWRSVLILSTNLRLGLPSGLLPS